LSPALAASCLRLVARQEQSKVVAQPTIDRVVEANLQNLGCGVPLRRATLKRTLRAWKRYGWRRPATIGRLRMQLRH
jgi:hypothetical protein